MLTSFQTRLKRASRLLPLALLPFAAQAQSLNYAPSNATNVAGTYTDLASTGTAITTANADDDNSAAQSIGFTFSFNGATFTQFVLNTNGFLKLGATAPSAAAMFLPEGTATNIDPFQSPNPADVNIIAPFNVDLTAGNGAGGAEYRVTTTGTAPNRVCTIQWKNVSDKAATAATQLANFSFQTKLYETTNNVEFIYDAAVAGTGADALRFSQVGLKGSGFANSQFVQALKQSAAAWSAATFASVITNNTLNTLNFRGSVRPVSGTTYRFTPGAVAAPTNDNCANAIALTVGTTCTNTVGTTTGATASAAPVPAPSCGGPALGPLLDVWYSLTVPTNGSIAVTTSATPGSALDDTVLELYSGACGALVSIGCNDDVDGSTGFSRVSLSGQTPGATLYARVRSYGTTATGQFGICAIGVPNNDAAVALIYTQGQLAAFSPNHVVRAGISNVGSNPYTGTATLTVNRGATVLFTATQPVTALAAGASTTVVFTAYDAATMANAGTNNITVSLGADENAANNTRTVDQVVSATTFNYASPTTASPITIRFGPTGMGTGNIGSRFTTTATRQVVSIQAYMATGVGTATGILFSATGAELGRSAVRTLAPADAGTVITFTLTTPVSVTAGDFIAGLNLAGGAGLGSQNEEPTRAATFYQINPGPALVDVASANLGRFNLGAVTTAVVSATRNEALAATVGLYPNPAHGTFTLGVPAGSLRNASATLINALGQVVQTRQLSLPAAGGNTDFDVSRLAPGVYSLSLKSGNDLVVKRVVVE